ncbi:basement membrane proteoglycan-like [Pecten maximus]|uniref:basement membrane proteoglycan-like n=1 Tax=Pecten maximus TaxID=6579 RepID=UPI0014583928|nr:basement membrane proteoglycan-like [Pecten maximus]
MHRHRTSIWALPVTASDEHGRLVISEIQLNYAGDYVCSAVGVYITYKESVRLDVRRLVGSDPTPSPVEPCGAGKFESQNGECIPSEYLCDRDPDCVDGSDEVSCPAADYPCDPDEFLCTNGVCAWKIWRCDGNNDCGDRSDEHNCGTAPPGAQCRVNEYECSTNNQCVLAGYQCDGEFDCQDSSDEIGCSEPAIVIPPVTRIGVDIGGRFTIICEAVGTPTPLIVWYLNAENIPVGDRVYVQSADGRGNLTITDVRITDSGTYTCEAINKKGIVFASPDAIVSVR